METGRQIKAGEREREGKERGGFSQLFQLSHLVLSVCKNATEAAITEVVTSPVLHKNFVSVLLFNARLGAGMTISEFVQTDQFLLLLCGLFILMHALLSSPFYLFSLCLLPPLTPK